MGKYTSYYLYQKYEKIGSQDWTPVYPQTLSVYSDGTESGSTVIKSDNDISCGYKPSTEVQYRWVKLNPSTDYICDNCELWVASGYICDHEDLYEQLNEQNFDGKNWYYTGVKKKGKLIEEHSKNCTGDTGGTGGDTGTTTGSTTGDTGSTTGSTTGGTPSMKVTYVDNTEKTFYNLKKIDKNTDSNKANAKNVEVYDSVTNISTESFKDCSKLESIVISNDIPHTVSGIGNYAFMNCEKLASVVLPNRLTSINPYAFYNCSSLKHIVIPSLVGVIANHAFSYCSSLTDFTIPGYVAEIGDSAFAFCSKLALLVVKAKKPPILGDNVFADSAIQTIYVPAASLNSYISADGWKDYASKIKAIP